MSNQAKKLNLVLDDKKNNINLISVEKSPNKNININFSQQNNNSSNINNSIQKKNDLLDIKNEEDLSISNINIEHTQRLYQNADFLFTDEDEKEDVKKDSLLVNMNNSNKLRDQDISRDGISINEEKRIEYANNLFDKSLSSSLNSNISNEPSVSLVLEKRKEAAEQLFQSVSDVSSKKKSLNETIKSNKSTRSNMSHVINNLSGSNIGLNINAIANKYANLDKIINEYDGESSIMNNENKINNNMNNNSNNNSFNEYDVDIDEQNDEEIHFKKNLIEFNKLGNEINSRFNNLNNINILKSTNKKDNNLITSVNKNDLMRSSNEYNNNHLERESKKNILDQENNMSNSDISIGNNIINNLPLNNNKNENNKKEKQDKKIKIDESQQKDNQNENIIKNKNNLSTKIKLEQLFKKNKNKYKKNEGRKIDIIDKGESEDEASNDILNKKIRINTNEKNDSSILNKIPSRISIDDDNINILNKKNVNDKNNKIHLINEKSQEKQSINREEKETSDLFISKINDKDKNLISDKNSVLLPGGRSSLLSENEQNKFIKIKKKRKKEENGEFKEDDKKKESTRSNNNNKNINIDKNDEISFHNEKQLVYFNKENNNKEKRFKYYLKEKDIYYDNNCYDKEENDRLLKVIKENSYFENYILKKETIYDIINKIEKKPKDDIPFYFDIMKNNYNKNKDSFSMIFQFISNNDKQKIVKLYKTYQNYNIAKYYISPHINDINSFNKTFKIKNNKTLEYIRYTIDENSGDNFYRCFIFNLFEKYILNKKKDNIYMIIFDIFKLYDLSPSIFTDNKNININEALIFFSILIDYIELNLWEKVFDLYLSLFWKIDPVLIIYIKYNIFIFLTKLYSIYDNNDSENNNSEIYTSYINLYKKIIFNYNDPTYDIFQLIPYIYGIKLEIIYFENENEEEFEVKKLSFECPKKIDKNNFEKIYIIYFNNCYHIGYQKNDFDNNNLIFKSMKENLNKMSINQYIKKDKIYCESCDKYVDCIELIIDNNKGICSQCLCSEIDDHLNKRISFINDDYKDHYIDYTYYLRPIELFLKEPISIKDNIENNSIIIKNTDYFLLFEETFSQKISELFKKNIIKNSIIKNNKKDNIIIQETNNINSHEGEVCSICQKSDDILTSKCGCKFCIDCLYDIFLNVTDNKIILNGYEKLQLFSKGNGKCPQCNEIFNLQYLTILFEDKGKNFEEQYNNSKKRMKNYCKTICFICEKKFNNEKILEVSHNSKKELFQINVTINKHCIKRRKKINEINNENDYERENEIDYSDTQHIICIECYKKNKGGKIKKMGEITYKEIMCNICGIQHYINLKEWDRLSKNDICCKCNIF